MAEWNVLFELVEDDLNDDRVVELMDALGDYHPAIANGYRNRARATVTLLAENLRQAMSTALALAESAGGSLPLYVEAMLTDEVDTREGFTPVPALLSASDAGEYLGVSRVRVNQMIDEGRFPTAQKVGNNYVIPRDAVWQDAKLRTVIGWSGIDIRDEHRRQVIDPLLDALRLVGPVAAYNAHLAVERGEVTASSLADHWREAERDALNELALLGYDTSAGSLRAERLSSRTGSGRPAS